MSEGQRAVEISEGQSAVEMSEEVRVQVKCLKIIVPLPEWRSMWLLCIRHCVYQESGIVIHPL